jgi:hypothetical protein
MWVHQESTVEIQPGLQPPILQIKATSVFPVLRRESSALPPPTSWNSVSALTDNLIISNNTEDPSVTRQIEAESVDPAFRRKSSALPPPTSFCSISVISALPTLHNSETDDSSMEETLEFNFSKLFSEHAPRARLFSREFQGGIKLYEKGERVVVPIRNRRRESSDILPAVVNSNEFAMQRWVTTEFNACSANFLDGIDGRTNNLPSRHVLQDTSSCECCDLPNAGNGTRPEVSSESDGAPSCRDRSTRNESTSNAALPTLPTLRVIAQDYADTNGQSESAAPAAQGAAALRVIAQDSANTNGQSSAPAPLGAAFGAGCGVVQAPCETSGNPQPQPLVEDDEVEEQELARCQCMSSAAARLISLLTFKRETTSSDKNKYNL